MAEKKTSTRRTKKSSDLSTKETVLEKDSAPTVDLEKAAAAEKAAAERAAAEKAAAERAAAEKAAAERAAADRAAAEKAAAERAAAEKAAADRAAAEKAAAEKAAKNLVGKRVKTLTDNIFFVKEQLDENTVLVGKLKKSKTYKLDIRTLRILD